MTLVKEKLVMRDLDRFQLLRQTGFTLMEMLVASVVGVIAVSAMAMIMAGTLGAATQTIEFSRLTEDMRTGVQIMSRELRRANYHANFLQCYGNVNCRDDLGISGTIKEIGIADSGNNDCLWFWYQRPGGGNFVAAFRRGVNADGVGALQMTVVVTGTPDCDDATNWIDITDTNFADVLTFNVSNADSICEDLAEASGSQTIERIALTVSAQPVLDASVKNWMQGLFGVTGANSPVREITEFISVRNNLTDSVVCS